MHDTPALHAGRSSEPALALRRDHLWVGLCVFSEHFTLPLSHDEVVYGKGSLIRKMPGDAVGRSSPTCARISRFMWTYPGKKLLFMGGEFAQDREWNHDTGLDWDLLDVRGE